MINDFRIENFESSKLVKKVYFKDRFLMYINEKEVDEFLNKINKNINCYSLPKLITKMKYEGEFTPIIFFAITEEDKATMHKLLEEYGYSYRDVKDLKEEDKNVFITFMTAGFPRYTAIRINDVQLYRDLDYIVDNKICNCGMNIKNVEKELLFFKREE